MKPTSGAEIKSTNLNLSCKICFKSFPDNWKLNRHEKVHNKSWEDSSRNLNFIDSWKRNYSNYTSRNYYKSIKAFSNTFDKDIFFPFQIVKNDAGLC